MIHIGEYFSDVRPHEKKEMLQTDFQRPFEETLALVDKIRERQKPYNPSAVGIESPDYAQTYELSNIILLSGERGSGKSTLLLNVMHEISKSKEKNYHTDASLRPFLPSRLENDENLPGALLAFLTEQVHNLYDEKLLKGKKLDHGEMKKFQEDTQELFKLFAKVFRQLKTLKYDTIKSVAMKSSDDELETLLALAGTAKVKENFGKLITKYLKYNKNYKGTEADTLLLTVDDFDLNFSHCHSLLEDLRVFSALPNVVVIICAKEQQLQFLLEKHFRGILGETVSEPKNIAAKYLDKLIPHHQRVQLPVWDRMSVANLHIGIKDTENALQKTLRFSDYFVSLIYRKTGVLLVLDEHHRHPLVPFGLREINQSVMMFRKFPDVDRSEWFDTWFRRGYKEDEKEKLTTREAEDYLNVYKANLNKTEEWIISFCQTVPHSSMEHEDIQILRDMIAYPDDESLNTFVWEKLSKPGKRYRDKKNKKRETSGAGLNVNIPSFGEVCEKIHKSSHKSNKQVFAAAIRFVYSIRAIKMYVATFSEVVVGFDKNNIDYEENFKDAKKQAIKRLGRLYNGMVCTVDLPLYEADDLDNAILIGDLKTKANFWYKAETDKEPLKTAETEAKDTTPLKTAEAEKDKEAEETRKKFMTALPFCCYKITNELNKNNRVGRNIKDPNAATIYSVSLHWAAAIGNVLNFEGRINDFCMHEDVDYDKNLLSIIEDWIIEHAMSAFRYDSPEVLYSVINYIHSHRSRPLLYRMDNLSETDNHLREFEYALRAGFYKVLENTALCLDIDEAIHNGWFNAPPKPKLANSGEPDVKVYGSLSSGNVEMLREERYKKFLEMMEAITNCPLYTAMREDPTEDARKDKLYAALAQLFIAKGEKVKKENILALLCGDKEKTKDIQKFVTEHVYEPLTENPEYDMYRYRAYKAMHELWLYELTDEDIKLIKTQKQKLSNKKDSEDNYLGEQTDYQKTVSKYMGKLNTENG